MTARKNKRRVVNYHAIFFPNLSVLQFVRKLDIPAKSTRKGNLIIEGNPPTRIDSITTVSALKAIDKGVRKGDITGIYVEWSEFVKTSVGAVAIRNHLARDFGFDHVELRAITGKYVGLPQFEKGVLFQVGVIVTPESTTLDTTKNFSKLLAEITLRLGEEGLKLQCSQVDMTHTICAVEETK